eukprot:Rhum_TRINITY_DN14934_c19_g1::Rhum_TRINITY_DN14934_c19_g1_i1::g.129474::m.129474
MDDSGGAFEQEALCCVCIDFYTDPVSLDCEHTVCRPCAARLLEFDGLCSPSGALRCPQCRAETDVGAAEDGRAGGVASLKPNEALRALSDRLRAERSRREQATCGNCEEVVAAFDCEDCGFPLCVPCRDGQHAKGGYRRHRIHPLGTLQRLRPRSCPTHLRELDLYDAERNEVLCIYCLQLSAADAGVGGAAGGGGEGDGAGAAQGRVETAAEEDASVEELNTVARGAEQRHAAAACVGREASAHRRDGGGRRRSGGGSGGAVAVAAADEHDRLHEREDDLLRALLARRRLWILVEHDGAAAAHRGGHRKRGDAGREAEGGPGGDAEHGTLHGRRAPPGRPVGHQGADADVCAGLELDAFCTLPARHREREGRHVDAAAAGAAGAAAAAREGDEPRARHAPASGGAALEPPRVERRRGGRRVVEADAGADAQAAERLDVRVRLVRAEEGRQREHLHGERQPAAADLGGRARGQHDAGAEEDVLGLEAALQLWVGRGGARRGADRQPPRHHDARKGEHQERLPDEREGVQLDQVLRRREQHLVLQHQRRAARGAVVPALPPDAGGVVVAAVEDQGLCGAGGGVRVAVLLCGAVRHDDGLLHAHVAAAQPADQRAVRRRRHGDAEPVQPRRLHQQRAEGQHASLPVLDHDALRRQLPAAAPLRLFVCVRRAGCLCVVDEEGKHLHVLTHGEVLHREAGPRLLPGSRQRGVIRGRRLGLLARPLEHGRFEHRLEAYLWARRQRRQHHRRGARAVPRLESDRGLLGMRPRRGRRRHRRRRRRSRRQRRRIRNRRRRRVLDVRRGSRGCLSGLVQADEGGGGGGVAAAAAVVGVAAVHTREPCRAAVLVAAGLTLAAVAFAQVAGCRGRRCLDAFRHGGGGCVRLGHVRLLHDRQHPTDLRLAVVAPGAARRAGVVAGPARAAGGCGCVGCVGLGRGRVGGGRGCRRGGDVRLVDGQVRAVDAAGQARPRLAVVLGDADVVRPSTAVEVDLQAVGVQGVDAVR